MSDQILRLPQVINATGLSRSSLYAKIAGGEFLRPIELGQRSVSWFAVEVEAWIDSRISQRGCHNDHV